MYYVYVKVPWIEISKAIFLASFNLLILAVIVQIISFVLLSLRWWVLLREHNNIELGSVVKISYIGVMFNNILPSSIGGDVVRGYYILKKGVSLSNSILSLIVDRVLGLLCVLLFSFIFLLIYHDMHLLPSYIETIILASILSVFLLILVANSSIFNDTIKKVLVNFLSTSNYQKLCSILDNFHKYSPTSVITINVFLISILATFLEVVVFWLVAESLNIDYPFYIFIVAVPLITVIAALPISLGGLLVREVAGIVVLEMMGVDVIDASLIVILFIPIILISSIPGVYVYLRSDRVKDST